MLESPAALQEHLGNALTIIRRDVEAAAAAQQTPAADDDTLSLRPGPRQQLQLHLKRRTHANVRMMIPAAPGLNPAPLLLRANTQ
jgi:hypothetical protein